MVGRIPATPQILDGMRTDPTLSVPTVSRICPLATAAAEPPEDPPGMRSLDHGFLVGGVVPPKAYS